MTATLLIEIGTEELPPTALVRLSTAFAANLEAALDEAGMAHAALTPYATPRRLAVAVAGLAPRQPDRVEQRRGPAVAAAFDDAGEPTRAALGFARSCGVEVDALERIDTDKGEWLAYTRQVEGQPVGEIVPALVERALAALPIPKRMRWGSRDTEFVRPVHWVVMLYGDTVVDCEILGQRAGRSTRGHRFHHGGVIELAHADAYAGTLEREGHVLADFAHRRQRISELMAAAAADIGGEAEVDAALLDEVTALVEWPAVIAGSFDAHFLELPEEVLIASMQDHQKYFPVRAADGALHNRFVTISNIESRDPAMVRDGNERVIRPRLADADFFYRSDRAAKLESHLDGLRDMTFEKRLGSLRDKTARVAEVARRIAPVCETAADSAGRAALLSRCDLLSLMVGEFPELQGIMGGYYAGADGEGEDVAQAVAEFYRPRFAGDDIPVSATGRCIALADKLDTLVGIFGIGSAPTGDRDPFALRRAALGALRILIEGGIDLDLAAAIDVAREAYGEITLGADTASEVYTFMRERLRGYYLDRGVPPDVCAAVLANDPTSPSEIARRIEAVVRFRALDAAAALAAANKRIANILRKSESAAPAEWSRTAMSEPAEIALADRLDALDDELARLFEARDYTAYLERLAGLRPSVDGFFDDVMVMSEDAGERDNRLALLAHLHALFTRVADIAQLHDA